MKKIIIIVLSIGVASLLWWFLSPLFINVEVQDELDPAIAALLAEEANTVSPISNSVTNGVEPIPEADRRPAVLTTPDAATSEMVSTEPTITSSPIEPPSTSVAGPFSIIDTPGHPADGTIRTITTPDQTLVRFENYDGTNGPDLFVYLAKDLDANEFVNLGRAKGNMGNINYTVPADVDLDDYKYVMTWCKAFGVLFDYAEIN